MWTCFFFYMSALQKYFCFSQCKIMLFSKPFTICCQGANNCGGHCVCAYGMCAKVVFFFTSYKCYKLSCDKKPEKVFSKLVWGFESILDCDMKPHTYTPLGLWLWSILHYYRIQFYTVEPRSKQSSKHCSQKLPFTDLTETLNDAFWESDIRLLHVRTNKK